MEKIAVCNRDRLNSNFDINQQLMEDGETEVLGLLASTTGKLEPEYAITQYLLDVLMIVLVLPFKLRIV